MRRLAAFRPLVAAAPALLSALLVVASCGGTKPGLGLGDNGSSSGASSSGGSTFGTGGASSSGGFSTQDGGTGSSAIPANLDPFVKDDTGASGLPAATITALKTGGGTCTTTVLYPYTDALFPAEGLPPLIQWTGAADAAYVKMTYGDPSRVLYEAAVGPSNPGRFQLPQAGWNAVSDRTPAPPSPRAPLQVTLTVKSGGNVSTCTIHWYVAHGRLSGSVYYNSYDDPQAASQLTMPAMGMGGGGPGGLPGGFPGGPGGFGGAGSQGAILRLPLGAPKPEVFLLFTGPPAPSMGTGPCYGCHSVSARGSSMAATLHDYAKKSYQVFGYDVRSNPKPNPPALSTTGIPSATFGGLTPDGKYLLTMGNPDCTAGAETFPRSPNNFFLVEGPSQAKLWDVKTGVLVPTKGLTADHYMWMPQFSPNGDKVVFNNARPGANGRTDRRQLATMDYDESTQTFSNLQLLYQDDGPAPSLAYPGYNSFAGSGNIPTGANGCIMNVQPGFTGPQYNDECTDVCYPGWPFFTPDGNKVIFARGTVPDFASQAPGLGRNGPSKSLLYVVDVKSKKAHALNAANAVVASMNPGYESFPTVMPVAAGGQFWAFFTSRRTYGNTPYAGLGQPDSKKIWVSAIDIGAPDNTDPSHPPFYLGGQGDSGNIRAFPTLNPCKGDGDTCQSGLDCCGGTCVGEGANPTCRPQAMGCAKLDNKCTVSGDCCDPSNLCIGGFCALMPPPK